MTKQYETRTIELDAALVLKNPWLWDEKTQSWAAEEIAKKKTFAQESTDGGTVGDMA